MAKHTFGSYECFCNSETVCRSDCPIRVAIENHSYKAEKPKTNADRIRAMTDEELAEWIDEFWSAPWCPEFRERKPSPSSRMGH